MPDSTSFCPSAAELQVVQLGVEGDRMVITAAARRLSVRCPACGRRCARVHSRYHRTLADLPWLGRAVVLRVTVRRFFCDRARCRRRIFTEPLPVTAARYARRTARAAGLLELLGFALGGRAAARLARRLGSGVAPNTVLAAVRQAAAPSPTPVRVLGVDDWAFRRGQRYGTILVDLERRRVIDLLPDREAATFAAWLAAHPGIEIISRDRGGAYAEGARVGAPDAVQVADRFHLVHNLVDATERCCTRHHAALREAALVIGPPAPTSDVARRAGRRRRYSGLPANSPGPTAAERRSAERRLQRLARYEAVKALGDAGVPKLEIARRLRIDRKTIIAWLAAGHFPERAVRRARETRVTPFADEIAAFYDRGGTNAVALARTLRGLGYRGADATVRRALFALRARRPPACGPIATPDLPLRPSAQVPSARQAAWLLRKAVARLTDEERAYRAALEQQCPALATVRDLGDRLVAMLHARDPNGLALWLAEAEQSELRIFATGLRRDYDAVLAALCFRWSNGQVEGQVHRLKGIKRSMFGRAGFDLLRARVLGAA